MATKTQSKKSKTTTTKTNQKVLPICDDLVQRDNHNRSHDQIILATDITCIEPPKGCRKPGVYLSIVINYWTKEILGWALSKTCDLQLVMESFQGISDEEIDDTIVHSQPREFYLTDTYQAMLQSHHCLQSMSKNGNLVDNRETKFWFSLIKKEWFSQFYLHELTFDQLRDIIAQYIQYYNVKRIQFNLDDGLTPLKFKQKHPKHSKHSYS